MAHLTDNSHPFRVGSMARLLLSRLTNQVTEHARRTPGSETLTSKPIIEPASEAEVAPEEAPALPVEDAPAPVAAPVAPMDTAPLEEAPAEDVAELVEAPAPRPFKVQLEEARQEFDASEASYASVGAGILSAADAVLSAELRLEQARKELADAEAGRTAPANRLVTASSDIRAMHREFEQRLTVE